MPKYAFKFGILNSRFYHNMSYKERNYKLNHARYPYIQTEMTGNPKMAGVPPAILKNRRSPLKVCFSKLFAPPPQYSGERG